MVRRALLPLAALLSGCVGWPSPVDESGLAPHQVGGYCVGDRADVADIRGPSGVIVGVRPSKDKLNGTILLDVRLLVPHGVTVRMRETDLTLEVPGAPEPLRLRVSHVVGDGRQRHESTAALRGIAYQGASRYQLWFSGGEQAGASQTGITQVAVFTLRLPPMEIDEQPFSAEPVTFRNYQKWGLFGCVP
jgi:hypothetical protein